jgi:hypothetical protein
MRVWLVPVPVGADRTISVTLQPTLATVSAQLDKWASAKQYDAIVNRVFSPATGFQFHPELGDAANRCRGELVSSA